jgi:hypothetical protein
MSLKALEPGALAMTPNLFRENSERFDRGLMEKTSCNP